MIARRIMMNGKEIYNRDRDLNTGRFSSLKTKIARLAKRVAILASVSAVGYATIYGAYMAGAHLNPTTVFAEKEVIREITPESPVLSRIAHCESGNKHYKDGQVIFNANKNGTVDIGRFQINSVWNKKATELGLNLTDPVDNEKMAQYIYQNFGTEPWYSSKACWNK